jgi:DNA primase catalytic core
MTMSLHKLTAGTGYTYLTRQVAAADRTGGARTPLATYYTERGETPGQWVGSGVAGIDGLTVGDEVTASQMQALLGSGLHPLALQRRERLEGPDLTGADFRAVTRLGLPFKVYDPDVTAFQVEVAKRIEDHAAALGHPRDYPVSAQDRARIRTQVALEFFRDEHHRDPVDARELSGTIAKHSRPRTTAVGGYDLTFSPVKSVSALWAVAPPEVAAQVELAHRDAVADALAFIESHALYTREGANGVRQVDVTGLVATAFTHRDSRAGDPDLHTHVAVANKVQTRTGKWLSVDGRILFKANVAASETYNTSLEQHLRTRLGLVFAEREGTDRGKRPVREVVGVDPRLNARWSTRRVAIEARRGVLAAAFRADHGRPPTVVESIQLAQQATLETREAKHEPRTLAEQRQAWAEQAEEVLGGPRGVTAMVTAALSAGRAAQVGSPESVTVDAAWVGTTAVRVRDEVQARRATWQVWHLRAEAHRQVRAANLPAAQVETVVDLVTDEAATVASVRLTRTSDGIDEPAELRRSDGSSVYEVAGSALFTSAQVLAAEARLLSTAGMADRRTASPESVAVTLLEQGANGVTLNAGQASLVTGMATSGARLQLAIAPAGAGKTTAMRALAAAWVEDGGTVIGLAPSAAAATVLREQIGATTETLAKLTWSLEHDDLPDWATDIGPDTLVVIDEAGMADTLTLDTAVHFVTARDGQVRLIGDTQQLAAIGAGGVLRDIAATHGALHLSELMRFTDPAEGAASLALRDGRPEALGFYLDHDRVHVGDLATLTGDVFTAWAHDRNHGLDAIMLAPTRDLVSELNQRAQTHRMDHAHRATGESTRVVGTRLADGNTAYVGDTVVTRANDRRLRLALHDWVKNGDRWTVQDVPGEGSLAVEHVRTGHHLTLPAEYVTASVELGYATTIHGAQGISVDTMHGLATGGETRQQLYTMLTRGAEANHLYLQVVGDGDPHAIIRPDAVHPPTATDLLEGVLARDDAPVSATSTQREHASPTVRLGDAAARYLDALHVAAEHHLGPAATSALEAGAERVVPGIGEDPAWPALRAHLVLLAATGTDPLTALQCAATSRELDTAGDRAAVLDWRLDDTGLRNAGAGPLPWLPSIPRGLRTDPRWRPYLTARSDLVTTLADQVRDSVSADESTPPWCPSGQARPSPELLGDLSVWRAANTVPDSDLRPTGPKQLARAHTLWQRSLEQRLGAAHTPAHATWTLLLHTLAPDTRRDDFTPELAARLAAVARAGIDAHTLLRTTLAAPLPDDHAASALWWRISRHLAPAVAAQADNGNQHRLSPGWVGHLTDSVGEDRAAAMQTSAWWPALVTVVDHALARGQTLDALLTIAGAHDPEVDLDDAQAMVWRVSLLTEPTPADDTALPPPEEHDNDLEWIPPITPGIDGTAASHHSPADPDDSTTSLDDVHTALNAAAVGRAGMGVLEPTPAEIEAMVAHAAEWDDAPFTPQRAAHINVLARDYYAERLDTAWGGAYLRDRLRTDQAPPGAGYAPAGWTDLVMHLRTRGVSDDEMLAVGLVTRARTGRLIDRFRDRLILPITADDTVLGFVARRHPDAGDEHGPKYLNTPTTPLFHKGDVLYGVDHQLLEGGAVPVLVEGPLDALAVTAAGEGRFLGVAPLGTSLTQTQARLLATLHPSPIVAADADTAGRAAAERAYWLLTQHSVSPRSAQLPEGSDPASHLRDNGPTALTATIAASRYLAEDLIAEQRAHLPEFERMQSLATVIAADNPHLWHTRVESLVEHSGPTLGALWAGLAVAAARWNQDPAGTASHELVHAVHSGARPKHPPNKEESTVRSAVGKPRRPQPPMEMPGLPANRVLLEVSSTGQLRSEQPTRPNEDEQKLLHRRDRQLGRSRRPR